MTTGSPQYETEYYLKTYLKDGPMEKPPGDDWMIHSTHSIPYHLRPASNKVCECTVIWTRQVTKKTW